jgi:high-affinity iron transporter
VETLVAEALNLIETTLAIEPVAGGSGASFTVITTLLDGVVAAAEEGRYDEAERTRLEAYAVFEGGPEQRLANRMPILSRELEGLFWEGIQGEPGLAVLIRQEAPPADIAAVIDEIEPRLAEADIVLASGLTGIFAALNSLAIIVREGLEAVLIIGAIVGYLRTTGEPARYTTWVYGGVVAAIVLSLATWWAASTVLTITVANRELIEGVTSLIAVAVLFYVTNWLFHKVYVLDWLAFVKQNVGHAISTGSAFGLAALGFTVVYREGFETVLFYQALLFDADPLWVLGGFVVGVIIILGVAYAILHLGQRLPLKPFFTVTGVLLLLLAFSFTGSGIRELQEAGLVSVTLLPIVPENLLLMELFGMFPTVETTLAQLLFVVALAATFALSFWRGRLAQAPVDARSS